MGSDDLLPPPGRNGPDNRDYFESSEFGIDEDILEVLLGEELGHRLGEHGLTGTRAADHHDMPALDGCLPDDLDGVLLADHLVDQSRRYLNIHEKDVLKSFRVPAKNLTLAGDIGAYIRTLGLDNPLILAPDEGAMGFAERVASAGGWEYDHLEKTRLSGVR